MKKINFLLFNYLLFTTSSNKDDIDQLELNLNDITFLEQVKKDTKWEEIEPLLSISERIRFFQRIKLRSKNNQAIEDCNKSIEALEKQNKILKNLISENNIIDVSKINKNILNKFNTIKSCRHKIFRRFLEKEITDVQNENCIRNKIILSALFFGFIIGLWSGS